MMKYVFTLLILLTAFTAAAFAQTSASAPTGLWLTENQRSVIQIKSCDEGLCGKVFWIIKGGMQSDSKNPDESLRARPMCDLPILWGFKQENDSDWSGGHIYKADAGDTYHASLQVLPHDKLLVHGYIGMPLFGVSQTWTRVTAKDYPPCAGK